MHDAYARLFEPASTAGARRTRATWSKAPTSRSARRGRRASCGQRRGGGRGRRFPDEDAFAPVRVRVAVSEHVEVERAGAERRADVDAVAEAELAPAAGPRSGAAGGELRRPVRRPPGPADAPRRRRSRSTAWTPPPAPTASRCSSPARTARTPSRPSCSPATPTRSWVAPPGHLAAPQRHRARPRPAGRVRLARGERAALPLRAALRMGALALRLHAQPGSPRRRRATAERRRRGAGGAARASCPAAFARPIAARGAALERLGDAARRAALRRESGSTRSRSARPGAQGIAQFMPGTARGIGLRRPVRRRGGDRRPGAT